MIYEYRVMNIIIFYKTWIILVVQKTSLKKRKKAKNQYENHDDK